ncbi:MAG: helix-turn-helix transcriptional regulator [Eubacteriales bacterium]|nr:helix-turn-helix transcriptional regulator [Eubacteriales bacterium]
MDKDILTNAQLGQHLKKCRKQKNISGNSLAKKAGLSQSTISAIEHGHKSPTIQTLDKLCGAMDLSLEDFFAGLGQTNRGVLHRALLETTEALSAEARTKLIEFLQELQK